MSRVTRRGFIKTSAGAASGLWLGGLPAMAPEVWAAIGHDAASPFGAVADPKSPADFAGDQFARPHAILWKKAEYLAGKGGLPAVTERASVVVIGGGTAGLAAAYRLRDLKPIVLEQAASFGGNAKGEVWGDLRYGLGAAYINDSDAGTPAGDLLRELGLHGKRRTDRLTDSAALMGGKIEKGFWDRPGHPQIRAKLLAARAQGFPELPPVGSPGSLGAAALAELDRQDFAAWSKKHLGELPPAMDEFLNEYCWSSFCAGAEEVSAAQVLGFIFSDMEGLVAYPGGNAAIAEALYRKLRSALPRANLRTGAIAVDVAVGPDGVRVAYENAAGALVTVLAKAVVMTSAKFICAKVVNGLPDDQRAAIAKLRYRAYVVANVLLKRRVRSPSFELFRLEGQAVSGQDLFAATSARAYTDAVFGAWAAADRPSRSAVTFYKALPYDGGRGGLYSPSAYAESLRKFEGAVPELLGALGVPMSDVAGIRLARWGHALPLAAKGLYADGTLERAARPLGGKLFFGQQDNWASPCFESAVRAGWVAADGARRAVQGVSRV